MSEEDTIEERQENELEVLKSIYGEELRDLRKRTKKWQPLHLSITLLPLQGSCSLQVHAKVDLHIICCENYPNVAPKLLLEKSQGLSNNALSTLQSELEEKAETLKGEVMVFELAEHVKAFLHSHNKPGIKSFYEEMLKRQKQKEEFEREAQQKEKDLERQVIIKELQQREEILKKEEMRLRREHRHNSDSFNDDSLNCSGKTSFGNNQSGGNSFEYCNHRGSTVLDFYNNSGRKIRKGRCISHYHDDNCVTFNAMDVETGELLTLTEWTIPIEGIADIIQRQVSSIEQELNYLVKLKHNNLIHYVNIRHEDAEDKSIVVHILHDFVYGLNCYDLFIRENIPVDIDLLRHIATGVLSALDYLHRNNVVHKELSNSCIYVCHGGVVKVGNYSLDRRLSDMISQTQSSNYSKKADIYRFGVAMLSLLKGVPNVEVPQVPQNFSGDLHDFLYNCLIEDEKMRLTALQLLNHPFLKEPLEKYSPQFDADNNEDRDKSLDREAADLSLLSHSNSRGPSRVQSEFEVLHRVGKGAYGEVFKVRNKLDQRCYAIKRIELNPKNKQLNRKIIREVKLLSRLNHENVVRYYNSWIESAVIEYEDSNCSTRDTSSTPTPVKPLNKKELTINDHDIELLAPPIKDVEWSISYKGKSRSIKSESSSSSSEESSSDEDDWGLMLGNMDSDSDSIEFEREEDDLGNDCKEESSMIKNTADVVDGSISIRSREIQYMYIQMEFCEKSTLRSAIDSGLCNDKERGWRLFREMIEGLGHIHQQGMIHRDLKPVNIFLDFNDHVKIGDFGLATTNLLSKFNEYGYPNKSYLDVTTEGGDISLTGHVGTALYVAPELTSTAKAVYNQKVDIYSLGVIFFEMCYRPLNTAMERITVLNNLRKKEIILPEDFSLSSKGKQATIIKWLLTHDVSKRPTSQELLTSELVPPPVLEECQLQELVRHTLSNPHLKAYKYLVASCFKQPMSHAQDIIYDRDPSIPNTYKHLKIYDFVRKSIIKIFKLHGGQNLPTPLLMPKNKFYENVDSYVKLMTHSGNIVSIPHDLRLLSTHPGKYIEHLDNINKFNKRQIPGCTCIKMVLKKHLRKQFDIIVGACNDSAYDVEQISALDFSLVPFARYLAWNGITLLRRFSIERVFREKKVFGYIPRELYECAFDIVAPSPGNFMSDAELFHILKEIIDSLPGLNDRTFLVRLNHTSLIRAILLHCGIKEKHNEIYNILSDAREGKVTKFQIRTHLISLGLSDSTILMLFNLLESESPINKISSQLQMITKKKSTEASSLAKQALQELKTIIQNIECFEVDFNIVITPGLTYNIQQYSGMMFQLVCEMKRKHKRSNMDVIAAGGRYDSMIAYYRSILEKANMLGKEIKQAAVGISVSLDKIVQALIKAEADEKTTLKPRTSHLDAIVYSIGNKPLLREKTKIMRELWSAGIKSSLIETPLKEDVEDICSELNVPILITLNDSEPIYLRIKYMEKDRLQDKKISRNDLIDTIQQIRSHLLLRSDSKVVMNERNEQHNHNVLVDVQFIMIEKLTSNTKRRYENQIRSQLENVLAKLNGDVIILALAVDCNVIRTLASFLDFENDFQYNKSVTSVIEKHQRHKKYLTEVCDQISIVKSKRSNPIIILYSLAESFYKTLL